MRFPFSSNARFLAAALSFAALSPSAYAGTIGDAATATGGRGMVNLQSARTYGQGMVVFGLKAMSLPDYLSIPEVEDSYATLCWWNDRLRAKLPATRFHQEADKYPYLAWAEAHFLKLPPPMPLAGTSFPLSWEADASQARYGGMMIVDPAFTDGRLCAPHAWHAAEMFLYLLECA